MSNYVIDVNIGQRFVRNVITERTVPALEREHKWLKAAWEKFNSLPDDHKVTVESMRYLIDKHTAYQGALGSAVRAGLDDNDIETKVLEC